MKKDPSGFFMNMEKEHCRDNMIYRICWTVIKKRLSGMREYREKLRKMPDDELLKEYKKYLP